MTLKSTHFIGSARCPELNSNPSVSSNENAFTSYFCIHNEPMTFDLMTQESTHFIGSARCPELNSNPSVSSNENAFTSYFCIHNEPHDL